MNPIKQTFTPVALRFVLSFLLIAIAGLMISGFVYSYGQLHDYAVEVSHQKTDAAASDHSLQTLNNIQSQLKQDQQAVQRSLTVTATNILPQFEAIDDIQSYAARDNLLLKSIDFTSSSSTANSPSQPATSATPPASSSGQGVDVSISFPDEVNYKSFLQFLTDIENNIPKMQVQGITISKGSNPDMITSGPLTIHMYTN